MDAELQEKSLSELERLADILHETCVQAEHEHLLRLLPCTCMTVISDMSTLKLTFCGY